MVAADDRSVLPRTFVTSAIVGCLIWCHFSAKMATNFHRIPQNLIKNFIDGDSFKTVWWSFRWRRWPLALPNWLNTVPKVWFSDAFLLCGSGWNLKRSRLVVWIFLSHVGARIPKTLGFTENLIKTFWCLVSREFSGMIHWLWIIIPATHPATPTFSTSKKMDDDWGYPRDLGNLQNPPNNYYTYPAGSRQSIFW